MKLFWWNMFTMFVWRQTKKTLVAYLFVSKRPKPSGCLLVWWMEDKTRPFESAERASFYDAFHCFHLFTSTKRAWAAALGRPPSPWEVWPTSVVGSDTRCLFGTSSNVSSISQADWVVELVGRLFFHFGCLDARWQRVDWRCLPELPHEDSLWPLGSSFE